MRNVSLVGALNRNMKKGTHKKKTKQINKSKKIND